MSLAKKIEGLLKSELKPENIEKIVELAEYLIQKEANKRWEEIDNAEHEEIDDTEKSLIYKLKNEGDFISQQDALKELGIIVR